MDTENIINSHTEFDREKNTSDFETGSDVSSIDDSINISTKLLVTSSENNSAIVLNENELNFEKIPETALEKEKIEEIEKALNNPDTNLEYWQNLAKTNHGLINDELRKKVWPRLMEVDPNPSEIAPTLEELSEHIEYHQVVLDVNRSLKRFPPGIPYDKRLELQDQLTVLILRVIMKYPHLRYYQGYHDVAITFLLVVGEAVAFSIMDKLSTNHLRECMEPTMEKTSNRLNYIYPLIEREHPKLYDYLEKSTVGTMFALPWYLTWFGHSLNQYRHVVRLYDYFLASPPLAPLYVAAALVIYRADDIFEVDCDMASIHCLLTTVPDNLPFERILENATNLYNKYPPKDIEKDAQERIRREMEQRKRDEERAKRRRMQRQQNRFMRNISYISRLIPRKSRAFKLLAFTATATALFSVYYAYYRGYNTFSLMSR